jgi:bifunctional DNA-binding transcriptional regulator/antitoxin component of YhaV-PrlF toxin-antitoxin module
VDWRAVLPHRNPQFAAYIYRKYGLSPQVFSEMYERQDGRCPLCPAGTEPMVLEATHTDHDHKTKKVRALLCREHNLLLGYLGESGGHVFRTMERVRAYLTGHGYVETG